MSKELALDERSRVERTSDHGPDGVVTPSKDLDRCKVPCIVHQSIAGLARDRKPKRRLWFRRSTSTLHDHRVIAPAFDPSLGSHTAAALVNGKTFLTRSATALPFDFSSDPSAAAVSPLAKLSDPHAAAARASRKSFLPRSAAVLTFGEFPDLRYGGRIDLRRVSRPPIRRPY